MKILLINNNVIFSEKDKLLIYKATGNFFLDFKKLGHDVSVFQFTVPLGKNAFMADFDLNGKGFDLHNFERKNRLKAYLSGVFRLFKLIRKVDFAYMFYPGGISSVIGLMCLLMGKPFGFYIRGEQNIDSGLQRFLYRKASAVLTISPLFTNRVKKLGIGHAHTIRPMMDIDESYLLYNRNYQLRGAVKLLFVGRLERDKGVFELMEAVKSVNENRPGQFNMTLVGNGVDFINCQRFVNENNLKDVVQFVGLISNKNDLAEFYKTHDFFVLPTHHEGFPRVLYEAMILGIPIATTMVGSIPFLMKSGVNCLEIIPKDAQQLARVLDQIVNDYAVASAVARRGTETIKDYLSDKKLPHAEQLLSIIQKL
jgi:glycosyltransferase involved in cell wall biosynthesis